MSDPLPSFPLQDPRPLTPLDVLWQPSVILWAILAGEGLALLLALSPGLAVDRWSYFGLASLLIQWVLLLSLGCLYLFRHRLARVRPLLIAYLAIALLVALAWAALGVTKALLGNDWGMTRDAWRETFLLCTGIAITVGLLGLATFQNHWRTRQLAVRAKQAELEALQARIRPHFLFNTLNTGAALVHQRPEEAERLLLDLADLFRAALAGPKEISLGDELALVRRYLEIEGLRFGPRLRVDWHLPDVLPPVRVPALSVQPLVENAIRHGVETGAEGGDIRIDVTEEAGFVQVSVGNALPLVPVRPHVGHQVGLNSVRARVQALTGGRGGVSVQNGPDRHIATLVLPVGLADGPQATTR
ncbi:histidine kinase [Pseudoxanthomonas sp. J35]|uniref:sensor histidine kinase n=1 Tax=Pseudoxanthomonas sp. J35 TaxID=935852 RepID=UPI000686EE5A|nr:histidine kinase [Pseudoxanthomonas sp. J35]